MFVSCAFVVPRSAGVILKKVSRSQSDPKLTVPNYCYVCLLSFPHSYMIFYFIFNDKVVIQISYIILLKYTYMINWCAYPYIPESMNVCTIDNINFLFLLQPTAKNGSCSKSLFLAWKQFPRILMPKFLYCPKDSKDIQNKSW